MQEENKLKITWVQTYTETSFSYLRMWPTSIILTNEKLSEKYLGLIKFHEIPIKNIIQIGFTDKKWIRKGPSNIYLAKNVHNVLMITYKKQKNIKHDYILASKEKLQKLSEFLKHK